MRFRRLRAGYASQALQLLVVLLACATIFPASAAVWKLAPFVELSETYTNNIALQAAGQEEAEYITQLNPGFSLTGNGRRLDLTLTYRLQNLFYSRVKSRNNSNHQLLAGLDSELVSDLLFLEGAASYRQMVIDPEGDIGQGNIAVTGFREDVASNRLSPYLKKRLGSWSLAELRYSRDAVRYINGEYEDSISNAVSGQLTDARPTDRWSWRMAFSSRRVKYVTGLRPAEKWQNADFTMVYRVGRKLDLNATAGYENNEYQQGIGLAAPQGPYWNVGVDWRPTPRTNFVIGRGERYFGPVWNLSLTHRSRRSTVRASYIHDLSTLRQALLEVPLFDREGNPIIDPDTSEQVIGRIPIDEVYIRQRAQIGMDFRTLKSTTSVGVYKEYRDYQNSDREEELNGGSLNWGWRLSRSSSLGLAADIATLDVIGEYLDTLRASRASFDRKLGRRVSATVEVRRTIRERGRGTDYTENLISAGLNMAW